ncbi:hypothetical protein ALC62_11728 [Cyphomyrmex costatus]|uniref:Uncharacterized protein n=1 Tax=Cyphomyrmex costatus TaxID=456900 RepID=A0A195CB58_9HYME|nr:hypothetical protein ALC62_11728 [Cyphomyrmex costatus]
MLVTPTFLAGAVSITVFFPTFRKPDEFASIPATVSSGWRLGPAPCIVGVHRLPLVYTGALYGVGYYNSYKYISIARLCRIDYELFQHVNSLTNNYTLTIHEMGELEFVLIKCNMRNPFGEIARLELDGYEATVHDVSFLETKYAFPHHVAHPTVLDSSVKTSAHWG